MEEYKKEFILFLIKSRALLFGEFKLKSGRLSPYFINTGVFSNGPLIGRMGYFFAKKITETLKGNEYDIIFGPAYKGIPLAVATASSLWNDFDLEKGWAFNRKESKGHGDKGAFVGSTIRDGSKMILVDDVFTTGKTKEEVIEQMKGMANIKLEGLFIAVDRQEKDAEGKNAIGQFERRYETTVHSIVTAKEIFEYAHNKEIEGKIHVNDEIRKKFDDYMLEYGVGE